MNADCPVENVGNKLPINERRFNNGLIANKADARFCCRWVTTDYLRVIYADCRRETSMPITARAQGSFIPSRPYDIFLFLVCLSNGNLHQPEWFLFLWFLFLWFLRIVSCRLPDMRWRHRRRRSSLFHLSTRTLSASQKLPSALSFRYQSIPLSIHFHFHHVMLLRLNSLNSFDYDRCIWFDLIWL